MKINHPSNRRLVGTIKCPNPPRLDQSQSLFFTKLPPELRLQIYRHCLASYGLAVHLAVLNIYGTVKHIYCPCFASRVTRSAAIDWEQDEYVYPFSPHFAGSSHQECYKELEDRRRFKYRSQNPLASLMLTCSRMWVP